MKAFLLGPLLPIYHPYFNKNPTVQMPIDRVYILILIHNKNCAVLGRHKEAAGGSSSESAKSQAQAKF